MSIVKESMLILVSAAANSNKFYHVTLSADGVVTKRYGRVGVEGVTNTERTGQAGYNKIINQKLRKGYQETAVVADSSTAIAKNDNLSEIAKKALISEGGTNSVLEELVDTLVRLNNHDILETSGGLIKVNSDGLMTTPLGLINQSSIQAARNILATLERTPVSNPQFVPQLEEYLRLIPQKVGSKRGWYETFFDKDNTFAAQQEFLKQLSESLALREERKKAAVEAAASSGKTDEELAAKYENLFKIKVRLLEDDKEFSRINDLFEAGKSRHHHASVNLKLKRVYALTDEESVARYEELKNELGNVKTLWHGTRANNVLSILRKRLFSPPVSGSSIQIQGRLFGSGVYLAPALAGPLSDYGKTGKPKPIPGGSTKSLNYSVGGIWDRGARDTRCFMFLTESVLGREFSPDARYGYSDDRIQRSKKYDSIHAYANRAGLMNDEVIIWNAEQISIRYLCEFEV